MTDGQALLQKALELKEQSEETERQLQFVSEQMGELEQFRKSLEVLEKTDEKDTLTPLGRGVYMKSTKSDEPLFVEVGAGVLVRKTPGETRKIIEEQLGKFTQARTQLMENLESYRLEFAAMLKELEGMRK